MARKRWTVKQTRRYDSSGRRARAEQTRTEIVEVARRRFLADGYAATTVAAVAADARVSVDTVHKAFGGKSGLVRAVRDAALAGSGPVPAEVRSDALHAAGADPVEIIRAWGGLVAEVAPRVAPVLLLVHAAAATDPAMAEVLAESDADRLTRMTANARRLADAGHLRPGVGVDAAAEVLWTYSSPELYDLLVLRRGWSPQQLGAFVADAMIAALLPGPAGACRPDAVRRADR